jgi:hypothetical protein
MRSRNWFICDLITAGLVVAIFVAMLLVLFQ